MGPATLYQGDAALTMRERIARGSVDMIYTDPPFMTQQVWTGAAGSFDDRWQWDARAVNDWARLTSDRPDLATLLGAIATPPQRAFLAHLGVLMVEARRVLRPTGSFWLHGDDTMINHLRVLADAIFGPADALGLVIWQRSAHHSRTNGFGRCHDTISAWGSRAARWRLARCERGEIVHGDPIFDLHVSGFLDHALNVRSVERVGYPTQKPVALLAAIIRAATLPGGIVLDPTCGSGTTVIAALDAGRRAIGIDQSADAIAATNRRVTARKPIQQDLLARAA